MHPLFYILLNGDSNNYRLFNCCEEEIKSKIKMLYLLSCYKKNSFIETEEDVSEFASDLYHPEYNYIRETKMLKKLKMYLPTSFEESIDYFEKHPMDVYIKPNDSNRFLPWLTSKYYQKKLCRSLYETIQNKNANETFTFYKSKLSNRKFFKG